MTNATPLERCKRTFEMMTNLQKIYNSMVLFPKVNQWEIEKLETSVCLSSK